MATTEPRIPEVGEYVRFAGTLVEVQDVTPPAPARVLDYVFEDTEARVEMWTNGRKIGGFGVFNNFCGKGRCVDTAIAEAKDMAAKYGDGVEMRVVKVTERMRRRPEPGRENLYAPEFVRLKPLDCGCRHDLPEPVEEVVWTSKPSS